jgi:hypothetical protein
MANRNEIMMNQNKIMSLAKYVREQNVARDTRWQVFLDNRAQADVDLTANVLSLKGVALDWAAENPGTLAVLVLSYWGVWMIAFILFLFAGWNYGKVWFFTYGWGVDNFV